MARNIKKLSIAVAGTGYVELSIATLLAQHHQITVVDVIPEKELNLRASLDGREAYKDADFVVRQPRTTPRQELL